MATAAADLSGPRLALPRPYASADLAALVARHGSPLLVLDCDVVREQYQALAAALPGVELHYALKPQPHRGIVAVLASLGAKFDLATTGEVDVVRELGIDASRCIHTHPIKRDADIRAAADYGVRLFVVDNADEIAKFVPYRDRTALLLRVSFRAPGVVSDLSKKFGCQPGDVLELLAAAQRHGVTVAGLSFHVGSQVPDASAHVAAIGTCLQLMAEARSAGLANLHVLDIGGGFPVPYREPLPPIADFCAPIRTALAQVPTGVRVLAEPGRFLVAPAGIALSTVMGRARRNGAWWYYLDDGVYGTYSGRIFEGVHYPIRALTKSGPLEPAVLAGPTCDSIDVIDSGVPLPALDVGDVVVGHVTGAYTNATATDFNFFPRAKVLLVNR